MSQSKYPLCEALGVYIHPACATKLFDWIAPADLERVLEQAPVVKCTADGQTTFDDDTTSISATHTARLICIEPVRRETAEDLLRELVEQFKNRGDPKWLTTVTECLCRAEKILGDK